MATKPRPATPADEKTTIVKLINRRKATGEKYFKGLKLEGYLYALNELLEFLGQQPERTAAKVGGLGRKKK